VVILKIPRAPLRYASGPLRGGFARFASLFEIAVAFKIPRAPLRYASGPLRGGFARFAAHLKDRSEYLRSALGPLRGIWS